MKRTATVVTVTLALTLAVFAQQQAVQIDVQPQAPSRRPLVSLMGHDSAITDFRIVRITEPEDWETIWAEHRGDALETVKQGWPIYPEIDFERCMVVAVFRGDAWNCNGEFVESIAETDDQIRLRFDSLTFQTSGPDGGGVRVRPFGIWVLDHNTKPLVIEENTQGLLNRPPIWTEKQRFDRIE